MQDEPEGTAMEKPSLGDSDQESHTRRHDSNHERLTHQYDPRGTRISEQTR